MRTRRNLPLVVGAVGGLFVVLSWAFTVVNASTPFGTDQLEALFTGLGFVGVVAAFLHEREQADASESAHKQTLAEMRRSDARQLRPFVSFRLILPAVVAGRPYEFRFTVKNHGASPALDIGFRAAIWHVGIPETGALADITKLKLADGYDRERLNSFPDDDSGDRTMAVNTGAEFTPEQVIASIVEAGAFVVGLRIIYKDMFGEEHETQEYWLMRGEGGHANPILLPGTSRIT